MIQKFIIALLAITATVCHATIPLAKDGVPQAEIIIDEQANPAVKYAAEELQHWVKEISGAEVPIVNSSQEMPYKLILGVNPELFPGDLEKLLDNDGYAVRTIGNTVYIFGSCPKGVLNGVFKMLFKNSDIIWARPNVEFGTIFSKNPNFQLTQTDYIDIPVYILRGWQMVSHIPSEIWQVRNGSNWVAKFLAYNPQTVKYGMWNEFGGGHNLVRIYIPENKYYGTHPEFYPMIEGKRVKPSDFKNSCQLCFTNQELVKTFIKELDERIKANPDYKTYRIMIEDNYHLCECPECMKSIKLPNGKIVLPTDKNFRSTQFFLWLNQIARHMKKNYPTKRILTFGYFFTEIPPACPVESNISISFCPISKDSKAPMNSPLNAKSNKQFLNWMKIGATLTWREYFGLVGSFPRPIDVIAMADWKYANKYGVNRTYSEMNADIKSILGKTYGSGIKCWDMNSLYFWVMTNGSWNPYQNVKTLRREFFKRVYGPAASDVEKFYSTIETGWYDAGGNSQWNDSSSISWKSSVVEMGTVETCRSLLDSAAKKVINPNGIKMLSALRNTFEFQIKHVEPSFFIKAKKVSSTPEFDPDFNNGDWGGTEVASRFLTKNKEPTREKTAVRILYDNNNIYIGAKLFDNNPNEIFSKKAGQPRDKWPIGDKFDFFLTGNTKSGEKCYYQITFDSNGNLYDACNLNKDWNGDFEVFRKFTKDGWSAMIIVPFKTLNVKFSEDLKMKAMFLRYWDHKSKNKETSFWENGKPHNYHSFGNIIFN